MHQASEASEYKTMLWLTSIASVLAVTSVVLLLRQPAGTHTSADHKTHESALHHISSHEQQTSSNPGPSHEPLDTTKENTLPDSDSTLRYYYLIIGSFKEERFALRCRTEYRSKGYEADTLWDGTKYRVYIEKNTQADTVRKFREEWLNKKINVWVLAKDGK